ncbi:aminoacyl-tRNA hydrolase [Salibacterium qingdaonense]|uniref:Peptidyl-tRNA hydrolase n=1 Tax=Salibacterium qingdaonense TaxID=266892 RepID=A0A1I4QKM4_9BACI|nr:aminoacyl-tRNA hydrolase [Salibacterium qingdaonense]SFM40652.1 peptidyl-tRNA hydrolase, PTH1 family [Salibacterium qingdaonense]
MKVIAGLGNPGRKYEKTRHNVGFLAADRLAENLNVSWKKEKKSRTAETVMDGEKVFIVKPLTYMNLSGEALQPLMDFYQIPAENLLVIYDDLDLSPGALRLRLNGGHGGHNGLKSIFQELGTKEFKRIRLGIGRPDSGNDVISHVLGTFAPEEKKEMQESIPLAAKAAESWLSHSFAEVMNHYNRKN